MRVNLIFARSRNGVIGAKGVMPWHLPEDLAHFKATTWGAPVLMGRKTWESIPARFRPLAGRQNVVITRQHGWQAQGASVTHSLSEALVSLADEAEVWVVGGAQIYAQAQTLAQRAVITEIDADFDGDAHAPDLCAGWSETARSANLVSQSGLSYRFITLQRQHAASAQRR